MSQQKTTEEDEEALPPIFFACVPKYR